MHTLSQMFPFSVSSLVPSWLSEKRLSCTQLYSVVPSVLREERREKHLEMGTVSKKVCCVVSPPPPLVKLDFTILGQGILLGGKRIVYCPVQDRTAIR